MSVESKVKAAISMSGLLFQPHPDCDGWRTTRAVSPEIVAFHNKEVEPVFDRLSIEFHDAGLEDEDGYVPEHDEYRVVALDRGEYGDQPAEGVYRSGDEAAEAAATIMQSVVEERA